MLPLCKMYLNLDVPRLMVVANDINQHKNIDLMENINIENIKKEVIDCMMAWQRTIDFFKEKLN